MSRFLDGRLLKIPIARAIASRVYQPACTKIRKMSSRDENKNVINITRIYNDEDGKSHFGTLEIELTGSGKNYKHHQHCIALIIGYCR